MAVDTVPCLNAARRSTKPLGRGCSGRTRNTTTHQRLRDDHARGRPSEDLNLARCIKKHVPEPLRRTLLKDRQHLVKPGREEVQRGHDPAVRPQPVLLHHFLVVYGVADVDASGEGNLFGGRVKVDVIRGGGLFDCVKVQALHQCGLPRARHPDDDTRDCALGGGSGGGGGADVELRYR